MAQHTVITIDVLEAYALELVSGFPRGEGDKLVSRSTDEGCTRLVFEVASEELRPEQQEYLRDVREVMTDRLEILRHSKSVRGLTLFECRIYRVPAPRHDLALLNRQPWKEAILAAAR